MALRGVALLARAGAPTHVAVAAGHGLRRDRLRRRLLGLGGPGGCSRRTGRRGGGRSSCRSFGVPRLAHGPEPVHLAHRRFTWPTLRPGCDSSGRRGPPERARANVTLRHASAQGAADQDAPGRDGSDQCDLGRRAGRQRPGRRSGGHRVVRRVPGRGVHAGAQHRPGLVDVRTSGHISPRRPGNSKGDTLWNCDRGQPDSRCASSYSTELGDAWHDTHLPHRVRSRLMSG